MIPLSSFRILHCLLLLCCAAAAPRVMALDILRLDKSTDRAQASIANRESIRFKIRYNCASTSQSAEAAVITDVLHPSLELVSLQGSAHTTDTAFDSATGTARFTFINPLPAGSTGEIFVQARFKYTTPDQTVATNTATFSASNSTSQTSNQVTVKAVDPPSTTGGGGPTGPTFTPGLQGFKYGPGNVSQLGPYLYYEIAHGNTGDAASPLASYMIEDIMPAGTSLEYFATDGWSGTGQPVTVLYQTNLNASWRQWGTGSRYHTGEARQWIYASELGLPSTEWVTGVRFNYGTLPGGGAFHPDSRSRNLDIVAYMRNPATFTVGSTVRNCATVSATGHSQTSCVDTQITPPEAAPYLWTSATGGDGEPFAIGETFQIQTHLGVADSSNADITDPVIWVLLPPQLEYAGTWRMAWWATGSTNVQPKFTRTENFGGNGSTLLEWSWVNGQPMTIPADRTWNECMVEADVKVRPRTANGSYEAKAYASWKTPAPGSGSQYYVADATDLDSDNNKTELVAHSVDSFYVETGNGAAGLESVMYVRGELDATWTRFPAVGQTVTGGKADYELRIRNIGGVVMKDALIVDILPVVGDTGVIDLSARGSKWSPFLVDAVQAPAGVTVFYSTSRNPCRPELVPSGPPGCETANWTTSPPEDITTVRSLKFDLKGLEMYPGDEIILNWPMRAPWGAPTNGEVAWNSFGFVSTRADNGETLLASEPVKTGISIQKPAPPYYGDRVWLDANRNGIQDSGETGINGVRIELFRDNGDNVANPATDTFVTFTASYREGSEDGKYLFGNIGPGNYFALILAPGETGVTLPNKTADDKDSDGTSIVYKNRRAAIMPVTKLDPLEEDRTWDQGFYTRSGIPAVWATAQMADGRMVLGGKFARSHGIARNNIVRVRADGSVDTTFNPGTGFDGPVRSLAIRSDGMIWAGGNFSKYNGQSSRGVALLNANGTWDSRPAQPDTKEIYWVGNAGNSLYLGGAFGKVGGTPTGNLARLNADGSLDMNFLKGAGANGTVYGGAVLSDGSLIIVGAFSSYNGTARKGVVKLKPDGSVDNSFKPGAGASGEVYSVKPIEDGRMVLTGSFQSFDGTACNGTIRLDKNGKIDTTMKPSELSVDSINTSH